MDAAEIYSQLVHLRAELFRLNGRIRMAEDDDNVFFKDPEKAMTQAVKGLDLACEALAWAETENPAEIIYLPDAVAIDYPAHGSVWTTTPEEIG